MTTIETKAKIIFDVENRAKQALEKVGRQMGNLEKKTKNLQGTFKTMRNVGAIAFTGIATGIGFAVAEAAKLETLEVAFTTMIGSAEKAQETIRGLRDFTAKTPFQFDGVAKASRQLLSFGVSSEDLQGKLKFLGDIAAGANIPLSDMAAIFGKSKAKGKAMTEELLQLSDRGVPIIAVLAEKMGVAESAIFDMASKGEVSFDILQNSLISMSEEGGIFFDLMTKMSATVAGRFSTLKDNIQIVAQSIGTQFLPMVADLLEKVMPLVIGLGKWVEENPKLTKVILLTALALTGFITALGLLGLAIIPIVAAIKGIGTAFTIASSKGIIGASSLNSISFLGAIGSIGLLVAAFAGLIFIMNETVKAYETLQRDINALESSLKGLERLKGTTQARIDELKELGEFERAERLERTLGKVEGGFIDMGTSIVEDIFGGDPISGVGGSTPSVINFDFRDATISNKEQFMDDIKMQLGRSVQLIGVGI